MGNLNLIAPPTAGQAYALQVIRIVASVPSMIGASYIIQHVLRSKKRRQGALTRIVLGMSSMDLLFAITTALGSTIVPTDVSFPFPTFAKGTWATCEAFGFLGLGSAMSSVLYNASLALYYLLTIRNGWSEWKIQRGWNELWFHAIPLVVGWGLATPGLPLNLYNPLVTGCFIAPYPMGCETKFNPSPCQRGKHASIYNLAFTGVWVWAVFCFLVICMTLIYLKLAKIDRSTPRIPQHFEQPSNNTNNNHNTTILSRNTDVTNSSQPAQNSTMTINSRRSNNNSSRPRRNLNRLKHEFATQALLYCLAYGLTWFWFTVGSILAKVGAPNYIPILILRNIFLPLQGFWNAFIYVRPRYLRYRRKKKRRQEEQRRQQAAQELDEAARSTSAEQ